MAFNGQLYGTVGVELESVGIDRDALSNVLATRMEKQYLNDRLLTIVHDASVEFYADHVRYGGGGQFAKFTTHTDVSAKMKMLGSRIVMGYEIVTAPLGIEELERLVYPLTMALHSAGDFATERASTHYHIGFGNNLRILKNFLRIALELDPILFRLGGMGGVFRGHANRSAYARPLLNSVCVPVMDSSLNSTNPHLALERARDLSLAMKSKKDILTGDWAQILNPIQALEANTIQEFWASMGVAYPQAGGVKYHPSRYTATNFFSVPAHGTMEFRHFNQTLNADVIMATAKFLRAVVELSTVLDKQEMTRFEVIPSNEEVSMQDATDVITKLVGLCSNKELEFVPTEKEVELLFEMISNSTVKAIPEMPVLTHITDFILPQEVATLGKLKRFKKVLAPKHVDVHNIKKYSLFEEVQ